MEFLGHVENPAKFYSESDVLLLSSFYEGLPNVLLEALSYGTPVVSYDCPSGPREILTDPVLGALVPELNLEHFCGAISDVVNLDSSEKREIRRRFIQSNYSIDRISILYMDVLKKSIYKC